MYKVFTEKNGVGTLLFDFSFVKDDNKTRALILKNRANDYLIGKTSILDISDIGHHTFTVTIPAGTKVYFEVQDFDCYLYPLDQPDVSFERVHVDLYDYNKNFAIDSHRGMVLGSETKIKIVNDVNIKSPCYTSSEENDAIFEEFAEIAKIELEKGLDNLRKSSFKELNRVLSGIKGGMYSFDDVKHIGFDMLTLDKKEIELSRLFGSSANGEIFTYWSELFFDSNNDSIVLDIPNDEVRFELVDHV
ncbi:hypothetical protein FDI40_gp603 [Agrobacterium phage Atu_ph07]|uniref:Uncharacterized protein n=1 Tax=Agrobacterium phage Atu_ph07 TaxID=2024264 RepID=A0A2L0V0L5_9CAUD|nr:hypothetical protein FDI40_gp603 [Agrobacterium phage Atu_ph07]AUZ95362.1 hypothetical protein [Agrobacterium phage Atu_ph07]